MAEECQMIFSGRYAPPTGRPAIIEQFTEKTSPANLVAALSKTVTIPTADTVVVLTELPALGKIYIENTDVTNYVDLGPEVAGAIAPLHRILPGEFEWYRLKPGVVLRAIANGASVKLNIFAVPG